MFQSVSVRGHRGSILWGDGNAAVLSRWVVTRDRDRKWSLRAQVERADTLRLRQLPLMFTAPRTSKPAGLWCFPVLPKTLHLQGIWLTAALGPPEGR